MMSGGNKGSWEFTVDEPEADPRPNAGQMVSAEAQGISDWLSPNFANLGYSGSKKKFINTHGWASLFFFAAIIAFSVPTGYKASLSATRGIDIHINQVAPGVSGDPFTDAFSTIAVTISSLPPTVLLCVLAGWNFLYHVLHYWVYPHWIEQELKQQLNPVRWLFTAGSKSLMYVLLVAYNGETELTSLMYLGAAIAGTCFVAHAFEESTSTHCKVGGQMSDTETTGGYLGENPRIVNYGRALQLVTTAIAVPIVIRLCYNKSVPAHWITGLTAAILSVEVIAAFYYTIGVYGSRCSAAGHAVSFAETEHRTTLWNIILFVTLSVVSFVYIDKI